MERRSRVDEKTGAAVHGSQLQIQLYVNNYVDKLSRAVIATTPSIPQDAQIEWVSPLRAEGYHEYSDDKFLEALELGAYRPQLAAFWPRRGPNWDALAKFKSAERSGAILVEAKAHTTEIYGRGCDASREPRKLIEASLRRTAEWLKVPYEPSWTGTLYQSANRLAHLYLLREMAKVDAWLVSIYFLDDRGFISTSQDEWIPAIAKAKAELGIAGISVPYSSAVFLRAIEDA